jgi:tetratricopeptide (TPR) repeat protein
MRRTLTIGLLLFASTSAQSGAATVQEMISKAVALHDAKRYEEAVALYRDVLLLEPANETAAYELVFSLFAGGRLEECAASAETALTWGKRYRPELFSQQASCFDDLGKVDEALRVCGIGLAEFPRDSNLAFNCALARLRRRELPAARELLKTSLAGRPLHASSHFYLAYSLAEDGYQVPALLAALRYLSLEPQGVRAKQAAASARHLLDAGVTRTSPTNIEIALDTEAPKDEGDFSVESTMLAVLSAARLDEKAAKQPASRQVADQIGTFLSFLSERSAEGRARSFASETYVPFLVAIERAKLSEAFGYFVFGSLELDGAAEWTTRHRDEMTRLGLFLEEYGRQSNP